MPAESDPGEIQSNGAIEKTIQRIEDQARTLNFALWSLNGLRIPMHHPLVAWLLQHAATLLIHHFEDHDVTTTYDRIHGTTMRDKNCEFCKTVVYSLPARNRKTTDPRLQFGAFLGIALGSNQMFIGKSIPIHAIKTTLTLLSAFTRWASMPSLPHDLPTSFTNRRHIHSWVSMAPAAFAKLPRARGASMLKGLGHLFFVHTNHMAPNGISGGEKTETLQHTWWTH